MKKILIFLALLIPILGLTQNRPLVNASLFGGHDTSYFVDTLTNQSIRGYKTFVDSLTALDDIAFENGALIYNSETDTLLIAETVVKLDGKTYAVGDMTVAGSIDPSVRKSHDLGNPSSLWSGIYGNIIYIGDTLTGDYDGVIYFADDADETAQSFKWDDGSGLFILSDALNAGAYNGLTVAASANTFSLTRGTGSLDVAEAKAINFDENFTVNGGQDLTITSEDAAGVITLDEQTVEFEGEGTATQLFKLINAENAARTLTYNEDFTIGDGNSGTLIYTGASKIFRVEDNATVDQDLTTDAAVVFGTVTSSGKIYAGVDVTQAIYIPEQATNFTGTMIVGNGGGSLSHTGTTEGFYNTFIGIDGGNDNTTGEGNIAIGYESLTNNTTGGYNIGIGASSLYTGTETYYSIAIGYGALYYATASYNVAIGYNVLNKNTSGLHNTAIGSYSSDAITTGARNTAIGSNSLSKLTTGDYNTAIGYKALEASTTEDNNTAIGYEAFKIATVFTNSTALGYQAEPDASNQIMAGDTNITSFKTYGSYITMDSTSTWKGLNNYKTLTTLDDDVLITFTTGVCGYGIIITNDGATFAQFRFTSAGVVTLISNTADVDNADTDAKLCIYQNGGSTGILIKNRLTATKKLGIDINYYTP